MAEIVGSEKMLKGRMSRYRERNLRSNEKSKGQIFVAIARKNVLLSHQRTKGGYKMFSYPKSILVLFLFIFAVLFSACSHVVYPRGPIPVTMDVVGPIDTPNEISFVNGVAESNLILIATYGAHKYLADFKQWTDLIIDQLETELERRGVRVKPDGGDIFTVSVENARLFWGAWATRCIVNVRIDKGDGTWSKMFEGNNTSPASLYRSIDGAAYKVVVAIIEDQDFKKAISR
jgi:hypothetical protein